MSRIVDTIIIIIRHLNRSHSVSMQDVLEQPRLDIVPTATRKVQRDDRHQRLNKQCDDTKNRPNYLKLVLEIVKRRICLYKIEKKIIFELN